MKVIWITCPASGRLVSTGIPTDDDSFASLAMFAELTLNCPDCRDVHPWADLQGQLLDDPSAKPALH